MKYIYRQRPFSYDQDWLDAFRAAGVKCEEQRSELELDDCTILSHSILGSDIAMMDFMLDKLGKRKGKLVVFLGNEWKWFEEKAGLVKGLGADLCVTQLPIASARKMYGDIPLIEIPHGIGSYYTDYQIPRMKRAYDIGVRGMTYKKSQIGDDDREAICNPQIWSRLRTDLMYGFMLKRADWKRALNDWRAMPSCEAGIAEAKAISARHFDAIACCTTLVMFPGAFNGILEADEHYVALNRDLSNLEEVTGKVINGEGYYMAQRTFEYCMDSHTLTHRVRTLLEAI